MAIQTKIVGASRQISLGKQYAGQHVMIEEIVCVIEMMAALLRRYEKRQPQALARRFRRFSAKRRAE